MLPLTQSGATTAKETGGVSSVRDRPAELLLPPQGHASRGPRASWTEGLRGGHVRRPGRRPDAVRLRRAQVDLAAGAAGAARCRIRPALLEPFPREPTS